MFNMRCLANSLHLTISLLYMEIDTTSILIMTQKPIIIKMEGE